jgi:flavin reductase (DIM6/NTAB) family NADH-FMN oxidoreductase RutF
MTPDSFARMCLSLDVPMAVVTAYDGREHSGCLIGFHTQCSMHPPRWLACISRENHTCGVAQRAEWIVVHLLRADQHALAQLFGSLTGDAIAPHEKFDYCAWHPGPGGTPVLVGCDWIAGRIRDRFDGGDHVMFLLDVVDHGEEHAPAAQLGSQAVRDIRPGHPA